MRNAPALIAAALLLATSAHAGTDLVPIEHGTYVRDGFDAKDAPFAALLEYDGSTFSGPHSSACTSELLDHEGAKYRLRTTCRADGDGTPAVPYTEKERVVVQSATRIRFTHGDDTAVYRLATAS